MVSIQAIASELWLLALRDWRRAGLGAFRDWRHPGFSGEGVAERGDDAGAVFCGGGDVTADGVPVPCDVFGAEPAGDLLLGFRRAQVAFGLIRISG
jgi:hypothetical protein